MGATANFLPLTDALYVRIRSAPDEVADILFPIEEPSPLASETCIDKSWHAIHFLLTGKGDPDGSPLGDAILGGVEIGPDLGYGRARLISARRVQEIASALHGIDFDRLFDLAVNNAQAMQSIYGGPISMNDRAYIEHHFNNLRDMYRTAAAEARAVLSYLA
jgi:hypothetical protein